jgi:hypothetical protein
MAEDAAYGRKGFEGEESETVREGSVCGTCKGWKYFLSVLDSFHLDIMGNVATFNWMPSRCDTCR